MIVASSRLDVAHYFITADQVESEIDRVRAGRNAVVDELQRPLHEMPATRRTNWLRCWMSTSCCCRGRGADSGVKHWIRDRLYNAEWALTTQFEAISRQFDEMEDDTCERKADLEQVVRARVAAHAGIGLAGRHAGAAPETSAGPAAG